MTFFSILIIISVLCFITGLYWSYTVQWKGKL